ncbi:MAG: hypothetical protein NZ749_14015, partial [bacterium]|nr:hypothetical protein [bacterium]
AGYAVRSALVASLQAWNLHPKLVSLLAIVLVLLAGGGMYLLIARLLRAEEMDYALRSLRRRNG